MAETDCCTCEFDGVDETVPESEQDTDELDGGKADYGEDAPYRVEGVIFSLDTAFGFSG